MMDWIVKYWLEVVFGVVFSGISAVVVGLWKRNRAMQDGIRALLRDRIVQIYTISKSKGYCGIQERESLEGMFIAYHVGLKGNGTVSGLYKMMMNMPTDKPN